MQGWKYFDDTVKQEYSLKNITPACLIASLSLNHTLTGKSKRKNTQQKF